MPKLYNGTAMKLTPVEVDIFRIIKAAAKVKEIKTWEYLRLLVENDNKEKK